MTAEKSEATSSSNQKGWISNQYYYYIYYIYLFPLIPIIWEYRSGLLPVLLIYVLYRIYSAFARRKGNELKVGYVTKLINNSFYDDV
jgi:hypothetical protein